MEALSWAKKQWDRLAAVVAVAAGGVALLLGWFGASGEVNPAGQIPYLIWGGHAGVFLLGVGATLWLSADLRDEWHKLDRLEHQQADRER